MARIKPTIWSISDEVAQLQSVNIFGEIHDIHGCFSICHTYVTRKEKLNKPTPVLDFNFYIYDSGLVTGFKAVVGNKEVDALVMAKQHVPKQAHELVKKYYSPSASDSFVCRITDVPPETQVQIHISFLQTLHLEGECSLGFVIPTVLAPKHFFAEETAGDRPPFASSLRQFMLDIDLDLYMTLGPVQSVFSPSHPVTFTPAKNAAQASASQQRYSGKLKLVRDNPNSTHVLQDIDFVLLITMTEPISRLMPKCYVESNEGESVVMVCAIPSYKPSFKFDENSEEGHPDPKEVMFLIDPQQLTLDEVRMVLSEALHQIDAQLYFNFLILTEADAISPPISLSSSPNSQPAGTCGGPVKMFNRSEQATRGTLERARQWLASEGFARQFGEAKAKRLTLAQTLKHIYQIDVVSEEIPRALFVLSRGHYSQPQPLFDVLNQAAVPIPIFSFGLGTSSNYSLLKSLARRTNGECEVVYSDNSSYPQLAAELACKMARHVHRITKPDHGDVEINWGALIPTMLSQTPSETLKYIHFNNGDIFNFFGVSKELPRDSWQISVTYGFDPTIEKKPQQLVAHCNPQTDRINRGRLLSLFQMLRELERPDDSTVRQKKVAERMLKYGVASMYSSFVGNEKIPGLNSIVTLVSATDTLEVINAEKKLIKYTVESLLQYRAHHTEKPYGVDLGEVEKGYDILMNRSLRGQHVGMRKAPIATRGAGGNNRAAAVRTKKVNVTTLWDKSKLEEFFRSINSLLNKMSKDNFDSQKDKLLAMKGQIESDKATLEVVVKLIYEKALFAPRFAPLYADLCHVLARELARIEIVREDNTPQIIEFKTCILDHCKLNFQSCFKKETDGSVNGAATEQQSQSTPSATPTPPLSEQEAAEERAEREFKRKQRMGSNITFIGELYLRQLLRPMIVHLVIRSLLEEDSNGNLGKPDSQQLELSVKLLTTIEGFKAYEGESVMAERYFDHFSVLSEDTEAYDMRIRCLMKDILDLKQRNWVDSKKNANEKPPEANALKKSQGQYGGGMKSGSSRENVREPSSGKFGARNPSSGSGHFARGGDGFSPRSAPKGEHHHHHHDTRISPRDSRPSPAHGHTNARASFFDQRGGSAIGGGGGSNKRGGNKHEMSDNPPSSTQSKNAPYSNQPANPRGGRNYPERGGSASSGNQSSRPGSQGALPQYQIVTHDRTGPSVSPRDQHNQPPPPVKQPTVQPQHIQQNPDRVDSNAHERGNDGFVTQGGKNRKSNKQQPQSNSYNNQNTTNSNSNNKLPQNQQNNAKPINANQPQSNVSANPAPNPSAAGKKKPWDKEPLSPTPQPTTTQPATTQQQHNQPTTTTQPTPKPVEQPQPHQPPPHVSHSTPHHNPSLGNQPHPSHHPSHHQPGYPRHQQWSKKSGQREYQPKVQAATPTTSNQPQSTADLPTTTTAQQSQPSPSQAQNANQKQQQANQNQNRPTRRPVKLHITQQNLDDRVSSMMDEWLGEEDEQSSVEYIRDIVKACGDVPSVFAALLMRYCYIKYKESERVKCGELIAAILKRHQTLVSDNDLFFAIEIATQLADVIAVDFPLLTKLLARELKDIVVLDRITIEYLSMALFEGVESGLTLKLISETAVLLLSNQPSRSDLVSRIDFLALSAAKNAKSFEIHASKYPTLVSYLPKF